MDLDNLRKLYELYEDLTEALSPSDVQQLSQAAWHLTCSTVFARLRCRLIDPGLVKSDLPTDSEEKARMGSLMSKSSS